MTICKENEITSFLEAVQRCRGEVILETDTGDRLNLKSTLSQFVFITGYKDLRDMNGRIAAGEADLSMLSRYLTE